MSRNRIRAQGTAEFFLIAAVVSACSCEAVRTDDTSAPVLSRSVDVGGTRMYYEVAGTGPPILFLHAGIADCRMWDEQVEVLSGQYTVIRCDLRGFGRTPRGSVPFSHYRDVLILLDSLGIEKAHLVGASFGGRVAIDFSLAFPERVLSLLLCAPAVSGSPPTPEVDRIDSTEEAFLKDGDLEGAALFDIRTWVVGPFRKPEDVSPVLQQRVMEMLLQNLSLPSPNGAQSVPLEPRAMTRLEDIHVPTLVVIGDRDISSFQELSATVAGRIPDAKRTVVPGAAHMVNMEKPEVFNRVLIDFIRELSERKYH